MEGLANAINQVIKAEDDIEKLDRIITRAGERGGLEVRNIGYAGFCDFSASEKSEIMGTIARIIERRKEAIKPLKDKLAVLSSLIEDSKA